MSSFMSRFNSKKTAESPAATNSRNYGSVGPVKANSAAIQNQSRNNQNNLTTSNIGGGGMYVIQTELDFSNNKMKQNKEQLMQKEVEQLKEQIKDSETNLQINKEIIKNLLEQTSQGNVNHTLQQVLQSMQKENSHLQQQLTKALVQRNEAQQKTIHAEGDTGSQQSKDKLRTLEKSVSEMKSMLLQKEQQSQQKENAYNEVLQLVVRYSKNDKALMTKLRELKFKHAEGNGAFPSGNNASFTTGVTVPDDSNEGAQAISLIQENQKLKKDLDFASSEIERLRSKLIIDDYDMPPLSDELFGVLNSKERAPKGLGDLSMDNADNANSSEFFYLKEAISNTNQNPVQSRNCVSRNNTTTSSSFVGQGVPKLDFKRLKKVQEFKDWYTYASKLEDSVKYLRQRIKSLEDDEEQLNQKYRKEQSQKESIFQMNEKLNKALKRANVKLAEIKDRYKQKISKKCYYCNNDLEISMNLNTTMDQVQITEMNQSFSMATGSGPVNEDDDGDIDDFKQRLEQDDGNENDGNLLDNLLVEENNAQTESDKQRQQYVSQKKGPITRGGVIKMSQIKKDQDPMPNPKLSRNIISNSQHVSAPNIITPQQLSSQQQFAQSKSKYHRQGDKLPVNSDIKHL